MFITLWLVIGGGMLTLLVAAIGKKSKEQCSDYMITIRSKGNILFIDENNIQKLLTDATNGKIKGHPMNSLNLRRIESFLKDNVWIKTANLYFDNKNVLHVIVTEREPIARVFTTNGNSFYLDDEMRRMPISENKTVQVPVFTNFTDKKILSDKDSALLEDIRTTSTFIISDPFWTSQVAQIDITAQGNFEMIPVVGDHLVKLGDGNEIEKKFHRLFVFYQDVLSKTGFDKYKTIDVEYSGQIVADKGKTMTKLDSIQLKKNVDKLLLESQKMESDTSFTTSPKPVEMKNE